MERLEGGFLEVKLFKPRERLENQSKVTFVLYACRSLGIICGMSFMESQNTPEAQENHLDFIGVVRVA